MNLEFEFEKNLYKIYFNEHSVIELRGDEIDILEFCSRLESKKSIECDGEYESEKMSRICVVSDFQISDELFREFIYHSFKDEEFFKMYDLFVIENEEDFIDEKMVEIIENHPNHYWLLCGYDLPRISKDSMCILKNEGLLYWNEFI